VSYQPRLSYDGGDDGLGIIRRLISELPDYLTDDGQAFIEFDPRRSKAIESLVSVDGLKSVPDLWSWQIKKDLVGFDRIVRLTY
jgi:methylase of polypeptide subunit release factors